MEFTVQKANLMAAMDVAIRAIPSKCNMPVLYNFLIEVKEMDGTITSTDMSTSIVTRFTCMSAEDGQLCVDAKTLMAAVKKMGKADVTFRTDGDKVIVTGAKARYEFPIVTDIEGQYPLPQKVDDAISFTVSESRFRDMIDGVSFSASPANANKVLTCVNLRVDKGKLRLATTDLVRVSIRKDTVECADNINVNIPLKTMVDLGKSLGDGDLTIEATRFFAKFTFGQTTMISRLVDGRFFNIDQLFDKGSPNINVDVDLKEFAESIDRALVIVNQDKSDKTPIVLDIQDDVINVSLRTTISNFDEEIACQKSGDDIKIGLNANYVLDVLKATGEEKLKIGLYNANSPIFIVDEIDDAYAYIVLPISI